MSEYYVIGNWKMRLSRAAGVALARSVSSETLPSNTKVVLCPSFPSLISVEQVIARTKIMLGAQDCYSEESGAYTGEVSPAELVEIGCKYVIVGHSERRQKFYETDESARRKVAAALRQGLVPVLCIGETAEERGAGRQNEVLERQLRTALGGDSGNVIVAYEPVWAIGTGKTVTEREALSAHQFIRSVLEHALGKEQALKTPILYGGSVAADNVLHFVGPGLMEGALVGTASVEAAEFLGIISNVGGLS